MSLVLHKLIVLFKEIAYLVRSRKERTLRKFAVSAAPARECRIDCFDGLGHCLLRPVCI